MSLKTKAPLKQMTLNFGQKPQKASKCLECGLFYNPSDKEDNQIHLKYHSDNERALKYTELKCEKVVETFPGGKCIVIEAGIDSKQMLYKALTLLNYVDMQLGINENGGSTLGSPINDPDSLAKRMNIQDSTKFYVYASQTTKKIVGFCVAERIDKAYKIVYLNGRQETSSFTYDENCAAERVKCGISRIWVDPSMRRQGIASRLLDCVRLNFLFIRSLELKDMAFSDPTHFGQAFAKGYFKTDSFLVYNSTRS